MKSDININRMNEQVDEHAYVCIAVRSWSSGPSRLLVACRSRLHDAAVFQPRALGNQPYSHTRHTDPLSRPG